MENEQKKEEEKLNEHMADKIELQKDCNMQDEIMSEMACIR